MKDVLAWSVMVLLYLSWTLDFVELGIDTANPAAWRYAGLFALGLLVAVAALLGTVKKGDSYASDVETKTDD